MRSAISHTQPEKAERVSRTRGEMEKILVFADQDSLLCNGRFVEFAISHSTLGIIQRVGSVITPSP